MKVTLSRTQKSNLSAVDVGKRIAGATFSFLLAVLLSSSINATTLVANSAHAQDTQSDAKEAFAEALDAYQQGNWTAAYRRLTALADRNHGDAARIALYMHRFGPNLYGGKREATKEQRENWLRIASQQMASKTGDVSE